MSFPFNVYLAAVLAAFCTTAATLPLWRRWCIRTGLVDAPGYRKIHHEPVPLAGGLAVLTGLLLPTAGAALLLWLDPSFHVPPGFWQSPAPHLEATPASLLGYGMGRRAGQLAGILVGAVGMVLIGWLDDKHELNPRAKFIGQFLVALVIAACGVRITLFVHNLAFSYVITILWILTVINAFNFMDNMNGLCAGLGTIGAWYFAIVAAAGGQYLVALLAFLTFGGLLGFLPYNFPRARAFLGDAGSHLVGYILAVLAILPHFYRAGAKSRWAVLIPLVILAVPLLDLVWVVLIRWRLGKPFYIGDNNHLSHRLARSGLSRVRAVLVIWLVAALLGGTICFIRS